MTSSAGGRPRTTGPWRAMAHAFVYWKAMRLRIDCAYDGTDFHGWAKQPGLRTVQGEMESALGRIFREGDPDRRPAMTSDEALPGAGAGADAGGSEAGSCRMQSSAEAASCESGMAEHGDAAGGGPSQEWRGVSRLTVAGRTDTGVHAAHQVCHLDIDPDTLSTCVGHMDSSAPVALARRLNHLLPGDIAIHSVSVAPDGFDARFSALDRIYVYRIKDGLCQRDPRLRNCVASIEGILDLDVMNAVSAYMRGLHDFGSFSTPNPGGTTIRDVKSAEWIRVEENVTGNPHADRGGSPDFSDAGDDVAFGSGMVCFRIVADAFAHNMVRSLVNACVKVGLHRKSAEWFMGKIDVPLREGSTGPISACGLTLEHVEYPPDDQLAERARSIRARRTL